MMKYTAYRGLVSAAALLSLSVPHTAFAQMADDSSDDNNNTESILLLSALGLAVPDGTTELGDGAGQLESHLLLAPMLSNFGQGLASTLVASETLKDEDKVILWAGDSNFSLAPLAMAESRLTFIEFAIGDRETLCPVPPPGDGTAGLTDATDESDTDTASSNDSPPSIDGSFTGIAQTLAGLLRTDTTITGIELDPSEELLINAVASAQFAGTINNRPVTYPKASWIIPGDIAYSAENSVMSRFTEAATTISGFANEPCAKVKDSEEKGFVNRLTAMLQSLSAPGKENAPSLLESAVILEPLRPVVTTNTAGEDTRRLPVLRLNLEMAGGTVEQRSNIFTTLGVASGIRISGGMVGSYRLTNGMNGTVMTSGTFFCRAPISSFGDANRQDGTSDGECFINGVGESET